MNLLIIFGAKHLIAVVVLVAAAWTIWLPREVRWRFALAAAASLPLVWALARIAGLFVQHQQPFAAGGFEPLVPHAVDNSFPSDHTALGFALAGAAALVDRYLAVLLAALALGVGVSRVLAGLHYPADIAAGALVGAIAGLAAGYLFIPRSAR